MTFALDRLMRLWDEPPPDRVAAEAAFHSMYADPVSVNGAPLAVSELVDMARSLSAVYEGAQREILDVVEGGGRVAVAFRLRGGRSARWRPRREPWRRPAWSWRCG